MPSTPFAKVTASVNGGAASSGAITAPASATLQLSATNKSGWTSAVWMLAGPPAWSTPAGWTALAAGIVQYVGTTEDPPLITLPTISGWGKWLPTLVVNGTVKLGSAGNPDLTDETTIIEMDSANGVKDVALGESSQVDAVRQWLLAIQDNARKLETAIESIGSGSGGGTNYPPGPYASLPTATGSNKSYEPTDGGYSQIDVAPTTWMQRVGYRLCTKPPLVADWTAMTGTNAPREFADRNGRIVIQNSGNSDGGYCGGSYPFLATYANGSLELGFSLNLNANVTSTHPSGMGVVLWETGHTKGCFIEFYSANPSAPTKRSIRAGTITAADTNSLGTGVITVVGSSLTVFDTTQAWFKFDFSVSAGADIACLYCTDGDFQSIMEPTPLVKSTTFVDGPNEIIPYIIDNDGPTQYISLHHLLQQ